ncbi:MAG: hypothetical protein LBS00_04510 [Synergistaceae bacterium]|nr:hypothetical protein [Synergistaceae bacterium]
MDDVKDAKDTVKIDTTVQNRASGMDLFLFETDDHVKIICVLQPDMTPLVSTFHFIQAALHLVNPLTSSEKIILNNALTQYQNTQRTPALNQIFCKEMPLEHFPGIKEVLGDSEMLQTTRYLGLGLLLDFLVEQHLFDELPKRPAPVPAKGGTNWLPELILVAAIRRMVTLATYRQSYWEKAPIQERLEENPRLMLPTLTQLIEKCAEQNELQKTLDDLQVHIEKAASLLKK